MGFWGKVKGVFGRIGKGVKQGWDWISGHKDQIKDVLDTAQQFVPADKQQYITGLRDKGGQIWQISIRMIEYINVITLFLFDFL